MSLQSELGDKLSSLTGNSMSNNSNASNIVGGPWDVSGTFMPPYPPTTGIVYPNTNSTYQTYQTTQPLFGPYSYNSSTDVHVQGDILVKRYGKPDLRLADAIEAIMERLAILNPDFEKMAKYPALKEAYDAYKAIEALCQEEEGKNG